MSLNSARASLLDGVKQLHVRWSRIRERWDDPASRRIEKDFLDPLEPAMRNAVTAMNGMAEKIASAERECGDT